MQKRKVWGLIGLHSPKGPEWMNIGRHFIKSIVNSARGIAGKDNSEAAIIARQLIALKIWMELSL